MLGHGDGLVVIDATGRMPVMSLQNQVEVKLDVHPLLDRCSLDLQARYTVRLQYHRLVVHRDRHLHVLSIGHVDALCWDHLISGHGPLLVSELWVLQRSCIRTIAEDGATTQANHASDTAT
jgi:hypothetical protein